MTTDQQTAIGDEGAARFSAAWDEFLLAVRRAQARGAREEEGLSLSQYHLLLPLLDGPRQVGQLATAGAIAPATATRVLDGLERGDLVERSRDGADRRCVQIALTPAGRTRLLAKHAQLEERRHRLYERLDPDERVQSEHLLHHLAELLGDI